MKSRLPSPLPALQQEVGDGLTVLATPTASCISDFTNPQQVSSCDRMTGLELQASCRNRFPRVSNVFVDIGCKQPSLPNSLLRVR
jgi:hypothetical protein